MKKKYQRTVYANLLALLATGVLAGSQLPKNMASGLAVTSGTAISESSPVAAETSLPASYPGIMTTEVPSVTVSPAPRTGWYGKGKKKYYLLKNGKKAKGYQKIQGYFYYFKPKNGYALISSWKKVKINGQDYLLYFGKNGKREMDVSKRLDKASGVSYLLETNLSANSVMVYAKWNTPDYRIPVRRMRCSAGMPGHGTITGTYRLTGTGSRWRVLRYGSYGQYCSRINGPYLYHSVVYKRYGDPYALDLKEYKKLGKSASHGCIRLQVEDAKWIYDHVSLCTAHLYYGGKEKLPIPYPAKKKAGKTADGRHYDPTDDV